MRRVIFVLLAAMAVTVGRAEAVTVRDVIELSKAGLSDPVLLALIEVDRSVFSIDTATLKKLKEAGVSEAVIVALIRSGREQRPEPAPEPASQPEPETREPQIVVIDHHDAPAPAPAPIAYPVAVPVYVPMFDPYTRYRDRTVTTILPTDAGLVKARVTVPPNCIKAEPVFWGFGGKLRPGSYEPPPMIVCR